jgi:hypothetical protein
MYLMIFFYEKVTTLFSKAESYQSVGYLDKLVVSAGLYLAPAN